MTGLEVTLTAAFVIIFVVIVSALSRHLDPNEPRDRRNRHDPPGWF